MIETLTANKYHSTYEEDMLFHIYAIRESKPSGVVNMAGTGRMYDTIYVICKTEIKEKMIIHAETLFKRAKE